MDIASGQHKWNRLILPLCKSNAFDNKIIAVIAGVAGMAANMFERLTTAIEEINVDRTKYTAYGLAQCVP